MNNYSVLHLPTEAIYSAYTYYQIYVNAGGTLTYKGSTLPSPTGGPIVLDLLVESSNDITGTGIALIGKRKPENYFVGPNGINSDGTWSIK